MVEFYPLRLWYSKRKPLDMAKVMNDTWCFSLISETVNILVGDIGYIVRMRELPMVPVLFKQPEGKIKALQIENNILSDDSYQLVEEQNIDDSEAKEEQKKPWRMRRLAIACDEVVVEDSSNSGMPKRFKLEMFQDMNGQLWR